MIYKGVKYACGTCIKGHRSSNCNHVERPLFEIRKKGRPVTQCSICRDLRKTKQVHIKCACIHKSKEQQPILIHKENDSIGSSGSDNDLLFLPLTSDEPNGDSQVVAPSGAAHFSWAVVTPTSTPDSNTNLGFIFHKSSSQRFLEGQPRAPRKKSVKKATTTATPPPPSSMCPPPTVVLPSMDSSTSSVCSDNGVDFSGGDLTMILNSLLQQGQAPEEDTGMHQGLANLELASNCGDLMMYPSSPPYQHPSYPTPTTSYVSQLMTNDSDTCYSNSSSRTGSFSFESHYHQQPMVGCCGSPQPMCQPSDNGSGGESVVITIAPLSPTTNLPNSDQVRTRIVTCYCVGNCACPGCLVHPGNALMGDPLVDPYGFSSDAAAICPSSTASSIYSTSDDEDLHHPLLR